MEVYRPHRAEKTEMVAFHDEDYVNFLERISPYNAGAFMSELRKFNLADDCPTFSGLYDYCRLYTGGSMDGARRLNNGHCDIAVNWSGGLHHARKAEASGFCYINDIVLAIMELLREHPRVMYIDIDVHHGDGVQDAFYYTDRVMCISFHKFGGGFFPSTGDITEIGDRAGKYYSVNVPLKDGITDQAYLGMYKTIIGEAVQRFRPTAIVLQCGADSLQCDRLGRFNLSIRGHGEAVAYTKSFGIPLLVLGGGGYTVKNVARCWAFETGESLLGVQMDVTLPLNDYFQFFAPDYQLIPPPPQVPLENHNLKAYREGIVEEVLENLRHIGGAPSVQMSEIPPDLYLAYNQFDDEDVINEAKQFERDQAYRDGHIVHDGELYDGDFDQDKGDYWVPWANMTETIPGAAAIGE